LRHRQVKKTTHNFTERGQRCGVSDVFLFFFRQITRNQKRSLKMKIDIRKRGEIIKTYTADIEDVNYGVIEDVSRIVDLEMLDNITDQEATKLINDIVKTKASEVKSILKEIFDGVTEQELRQVKPRQISAALYEIVVYTANDLVAGMNDAVSPKN
jgi:hypothetical protein